MDMADGIISKDFEVRQNLDKVNDELSAIDELITKNTKQNL